jgi:hypothetical protein
VVKVELLWTQNAVPAANILHASYTGGAPSPTDCNAIAELIGAAWWTDALRAFYSNFTTFVGVRVTDLATDTGSVGESFENTTGTIDLFGVGAQMCMMVNYSIARRYRGGHPRTYYPGPAGSHLDTPQNWDSDVISAMETAVAALYGVLDTAASGTTDLSGQVCVSYQDGDAWRVDNLVESITEAIVSGAVRTQRRRLTASSY